MWTLQILTSVLQRLGRGALGVAGGVGQREDGGPVVQVVIHSLQDLSVEHSAPPGQPDQYTRLKPVHHLQHRGAFQLRLRPGELAEIVEGNL